MAALILSGISKMNPIKVLLLMVIFEDYALKIATGSVLPGLNYGHSTSDLKKFNRQATLRSARTSSPITTGHENEDGPKNYSFNYRIRDFEGNKNYREEAADKNGVVQGSYGYMDTNGLYRVVEYMADANGFHATIKTNEPSLVGKKNSADVQLSHQQSISDIQDKYFSTRLNEEYSRETDFAAKSKMNEKLLQLGVVRTVVAAVNENFKSGTKDDNDDYQDHGD